MMTFPSMLKTLGFALVVAVSATAQVWAGEQPEASIVLDGSMDDWPAGVQATADGRWIHFRYDTSEPMSIQSGPVMTVLQIDLDSNKRTGLPSADGELGIDIEITMTTLDQRDPTRLGGGIEIAALGADHLHESLGHMNVGFSSLPTHASTSFELRIARDIDGPPWIEKMAGTSDGIRYRFIQRDVQYTQTSAGDVHTLALPVMIPGSERFDTVIPDKLANSLRVVSWNVLWGSPSKKPDGFARTLKALDPDVILFQEWDNGYWTREDRMPERDYLDWLNTHLGGGTWSVSVGGERGVLIASRSRLSPFLPEKVKIVADHRAGISRDRVMRCASARVDTPLGEVGAVSLHLKSRGGLDSGEDKIRYAEASAVRDAILKAMSSKKPDFLVIAGDWNLVGGRKPLERVVGGLDFAGSDLRVIEPRRLGSGDAITWRDQRSRFAPGRLDYMLVADDGVAVLQAFILDTTLLTDASLRKAGLQRKDTDDSDHLPLVVDLRRTTQN